jgi:hypothetical protein
MILPTIISKLGLPLLVSLLGSALGRIDNPVARSASEALENFEGALAGGAITSEQMAEANRHAEAMAALKAKEHSAALTEINKSLRAEISSGDLYVRRMRPTFGYLLAVTWAMQMVAVSYVMMFRTEHMPALMDGMEGLSTIWAVALSVLGIYVYKRSEENKIFSSPIKRDVEKRNVVKEEASMETQNNLADPIPALQKYNN